jgi:hypothetical protein
MAIINLNIHKIALKGRILHISDLKNTLLLNLRINNIHIMQ